MSLLRSRWFSVRRIVIAATIGLVAPVCVGWGLVVMCADRAMSESTYSYRSLGAHVLWTGSFRQAGLQRYAWAEVPPSRIDEIVRDLRQSDPTASEKSLLNPVVLWEWTSIRKHVVLGLDSAAKLGAQDEIAAGFPFLSVRSARSSVPDGSTQWVQGEATGAIGLRWLTTFGVAAGAGGIQYGLPITPIWPGVLGNFAVYFCGTLAAAFFAWDLRRILRRKRGCCQECGYDLAGHLDPRCPECGVLCVRTSSQRT